MTKKITMVNDYPLRQGHPWNDSTALNNFCSLVFMFSGIMVGVILIEVLNLALGVAVMVLSVVLYAAALTHSIVAGRKYTELTYSSRKAWWNKNFGVDFTPSQVQALQYREDITIENPKTQEVEVYSLVKNENMDVVAVKITHPNRAEVTVTA